MVYTLDTNTLIYLFKGMGKISDKLLNSPQIEIGIPRIVVYELEVGIAKSSSPNKRTEQLSDLLFNHQRFTIWDTRSEKRF